MADRRVEAMTGPAERPVATRGTGETHEAEAASGSQLAQRIFSLRTVASFLLTLAVLYLVYRQLLDLDWNEAWTSVREASVGLFTLAFTIFYSSYLIRAVRWKALLDNVGYRCAAGRPVPPILGLARIMYIARFVNCVTVARLGDAYRAYLLTRASGVSFLVTLGTVLVERLLDLAVLVAMMGAGALLVFHGMLPPEATQALAIGLGLSFISVFGLLALRRFQWAFEKVLPKRLHIHYSRLEQGVLGSVCRRLPLLIALSAVGWAIEGVTLYVTAAAVGAPVSVASAMVVALAASLFSTVPFTPGGLGFTEVGMVIVLQWLGLDTSTATAVTGLFRIINYWSIVVFGSLLYIFGRNDNRFTDRSPAEERWGLYG